MQSPFIPALVIDEDATMKTPGIEQLVSLPAIPHVGDTIVLKDGEGDTFCSAIVTEIAYHTEESSPFPLDAYIHIFVSFTRTRAQIIAE